ncbi:MAG: epoxyqueuosine reductase QueH [Prevotellaceae bacterium]|jgi:predicted adenine nucleotide alpha hydrolase (AANH) superfamily ATPase|nr:epoxyqueuosine reductase QueH [Prevotellaceae bacterium]
MLRLVPPLNEEQVLLHCCCAPCSSAIVECLLDNGIRPTLYYYNPNIFPHQEYEKRKTELTGFAVGQHLEVIDADYDHDRWRGAVKGFENAPERGHRCRLCFEVRLRATASYAAAHGFRLFTTTLASSRWKNLEQINQAGREAALHHPPTLFWEQNWRKGGLQERRNELLRAHGFYNQLYCGCEFSQRP